VRLAGTTLKVDNGAVAEIELVAIRRATTQRVLVHRQGSTLARQGHRGTVGKGPQAAVACLEVEEQATVVAARAGREWVTAVAVVQEPHCQDVDTGLDASASIEGRVAASAGVLPHADAVEVDGGDIVTGEAQAGGQVAGVERRAKRLAEEGVVFRRKPGGVHRSPLSGEG